MYVFGIDPGLNRTGFGCVETDPSRPSAMPRFVDAGVIRLRAGTSVASRLAELHTDLTALLQELRPSVICIERLFTHARWPSTAVLMGHARGVILLAAHAAGAEIVEIAPAEVKKSVAGHGRASKIQMQQAVQGQLGLDALPSPHDAADALALALCAAVRARPLSIQPSPTKP